MMFCGAASFSHIDDENNPATPPPPPPRPRGCKKKQSSSKNPYSSRGLDKFSEVMSELDAKREKIMATAAGSDGVKMVRFMYTNSEDWIPIVVRLRDDPPPKEVRARKSIKKPQPVLPLLQQPEESSSDSEAVKVPEAASMVPVKELKKNTFSFVDEEFLRRWRPSYYWLVVMMVILVCLMMFGRVFAICCTSVWWYLAPTFMATDENENGNQRLIKKKDYPKIVSNNRPLTQPKKMQELNGRM